MHLELERAPNRHHSTTYQCQQKQRAPSLSQHLHVVEWKKSDEKYISNGREMDGKRMRCSVLEKILALYPGLSPGLSPLLVPGEKWGGKHFPLAFIEKNDVREGLWEVIQSDPWSRKLVHWCNTSYLEIPRIDRFLLPDSRVNIDFVQNDFPQNYSICVSTVVGTVVFHTPAFVFC